MINDSYRSKDIIKLSVLSLVLALLLAGNSLSLLPVHAAGPTFAPAINLSNDKGKAKEPAVSTSNNGQDVYVAWTEGSDGIKFRMSPNGGTTWVPTTSSPALTISRSGGTTQFPVMITGDGYQNVTSGDVYVAWVQTVSGTLQPFVAVSSNNGVSFVTTQLSSAGGITPALAAWGHDVYVTWYQTSSCPETALNRPFGSPPVTQGCIYVDSSTNDGKNWTPPVELNPSEKGEAQIVASDSYTYVTADGTYFTSLGLNGTWTGNGTTSTGWTTPESVYGFYSYDPTNSTVNCFSFPPPTGCILSFGREPWIAASGLEVYITFEAVNLGSPTSLYSDYGVTSTNGGATWYPGTCNRVSCPGDNLTSFPPVITNASEQQKYLVTGAAPNVWEPENAAFGSTAFLTMHSLQNQGIYVTSTTNNGSSWSTPQQIPGQVKGTSAYAHIFTSDGVNVWVMWGQQVKRGSSVWNAYVSYSSNSGTTWSNPIDISKNAKGVAAGNQDVTLFWVSSIGATCFATWTYTSGTTSQVYFATGTG